MDYTYSSSLGPIHIAAWYVVSLPLQSGAVGRDKFDFLPCPIEQALVKNFVKNRSENIRIKEEIDPCHDSY